MATVWRLANITFASSSAALTWVKSVHRAFMGKGTQHQEDEGGGTAPLRRGRQRLNASRLRWFPPPTTVGLEPPQQRSMCGEINGGGDPMRIEDYRAKAEACALAAKDAKYPSEHTSWLRLANIWLKLAEITERRTLLDEALITARPWQQ